MGDTSFEVNPVLLSMIERPFAPVFKRDKFVLVQWTYSAKFFGNESLMFESRKCRLDFYIDRSIVGVDISPPEPASDWQSLRTFLKAVIGRAPASLAAQGSLLANNYEVAVAALRVRLLLPRRRGSPVERNSHSKWKSRDQRVETNSDETAAFRRRFF
jgi:hypothetical protein